MTISEGGTINALQGTLGDLADSTGTMTVTGSGSTWSAFTDASAYSGYMNVGRLGTGSLTVEDGGRVTGYRLYIGNEAGSSGAVSLSGSGSLIDMTSKVFMVRRATARSLFSMARRFVRRRFKLPTPLV